jgi:hypothetical protein
MNHQNVSISNYIHYFTFTSYFDYINFFFLNPSLINQEHIMFQFVISRLFYFKCVLL